MPLSVSKLLGDEALIGDLKIIYAIAIRSFERIDLKRAFSSILSTARIDPYRARKASAIAQMRLIFNLGARRGNVPSIIATLITSGRKCRVTMGCVAACWCAKRGVGEEPSSAISAITYTAVVQARQPASKAGAGQGGISASSGEIKFILNQPRQPWSRMPANSITSGAATALTSMQVRRRALRLSTSAQRTQTEAVQSFRGPEVGRGGKRTNREEKQSETRNERREWGWVGERCAKDSLADDGDCYGDDVSVSWNVVSFVASVWGRKLVLDEVYRRARVPADGARNRRHVAYIQTAAHTCAAGVTHDRGGCTNIQVSRGFPVRYTLSHGGMVGCICLPARGIHRANFELLHGRAPCSFQDFARSRVV